MHLFTWNIGGTSSMMPYAFTYLERVAKEDLVIATLQEWPKSWPNDLPDLGGHKLKFVPQIGKAVLLHSSDLVLLDYRLDSTKRATIARFRLPNRSSEITCVGIHWHSKTSNGGIVDPCERGGAMALFRHHLEDQLDKSVPMILMGDFNCGAQESEMSSPYCLFARSENHRSPPQLHKVTGREKVPWMLVQPDVPKHVGTFFWSMTQAWHILDHIVLTPDLVKGFISAQVLTELEGYTFLTDEKQVPRTGDLASDHLPVVCKIHYQ